MPTIGQINLTFELIWAFWKNKQPGENSARKAFQVAVHQFEDRVTLAQMKKAAELYSLKTANDELTMQLNNFFLKESFLDVLEEDRDSDEKLKELKENTEIARHIIETWNKIRRPWWCEISDPETRIPMVAKALQNPTFKSSWKEALDKLILIFKHKPREKEKYSNLIVSITWFCDTHKLTVVKIKDGEYGQPIPDPKPRYLEPETELTEEKKEKINQLMNEVFGSNYDPRYAGQSPEKPSMEFPDIEGFGS